MTEKKRVPGLPIPEPWKPSPYEDFDATSIKAVAQGTANDEQQKRAFAYIVNVLCGTYDLSYRPNSTRDSDFAEGKRFVGLQLVKFCKLTLSKTSVG